MMAAALGSAIYLCSYDDKKKQFLLAAKSGDVKSLKRGLQDGVDVNCTHSLGWAPIHAAVINGHFDTVEWLIKEGGADINITDEFSSANRKARLLNTTPIRIYSIRDEEFCPHINHFISYSGFTPLHYAIITDDERIIRLLLENGADPTIEDAAGRMPIKYCTNGKVKKLLEEFTKQIEMKKLKKTLEERSKYSLEKRLREHLVGQDGAIATVASAIRRREMGWGDSEHPLVLLFLGSSGIGKTELAKQVAKYLHKDDPKAFIRLDMSEYQEKHEVAKLIGAPPGYIGYDQGGQLTTRLSQFPSAVVLFDEVDKAHPDVLTVLLQLFDEGHLTDGQGRKILCKDAIFVMTSNLASDEIAQHGMKLRKEATANMAIDNEPNIEISREFKENIVEPILKQHFHRDEFLGRINEMVYFLPFSRSELHQLVEQELTTWRTRVSGSGIDANGCGLKAKERHSIDLSWDKEVVDILADGYNVKYGARSIHHEVCHMM
jgi:ATP-dependent Clp protease ATP-binding subunit ClpB